MKEFSTFTNFTLSAVDLIEVQPGLVLPIATRSGEYTMFQKNYSRPNHANVKL